jgi:hypothetical protein
MTWVSGSAVSSGQHGAGRRASCYWGSSISVSLPECSGVGLYERLVLIRIVQLRA